MNDCNIIIVLQDGREIPVVYPQCVGREYETPWLGSKNSGCREWNIDVLKSLNDIHLAKCNPHFVIGTWGTGYKNPDGTLIPFTQVARIKDLTPELQSLADVRKKEEDDALLLETEQERLITYAELAALEKRVAALEKGK